MTRKIDTLKKVARLSGFLFEFLRFINLIINILVNYITQSSIVKGLLTT